MGLLTQLFGDRVVFVYHCFDRIVIHGYLTGLSRLDQVAHFFRQVVGVPVITKEMLSQRTTSYQTWAFARNHRPPSAGTTTPLWQLTTSPPSDRRR
jgi:hypothetical protein